MPGPVTAPVPAARRGAVADPGLHRRRATRSRAAPVQSPQPRCRRRDHR